jgi:hypothetical protein
MTAVFHTGQAHREVIVLHTENDNDWFNGGVWSN